MPNTMLPQQISSYQPQQSPGAKPIACRTVLNRRAGLVVPRETSSFIREKWGASMRIRWMWRCPNVSASTDMPAAGSMPTASHRQSDPIPNDRIRAKRLERQQSLHKEPFTPRAESHNRDGPSSATYANRQREVDILPIERIEEKS
jgi:hypothetical protein